MNDFIDHHKDRKCRMISAYEFGYQSLNLTYTGAIGKLQSGEGDMYVLKIVKSYNNKFKSFNCLLIKKVSVSWQSIF